jgi:hypothetical protein
MFSIGADGPFYISMFSIEETSHKIHYKKGTFVGITFSRIHAKMWHLN